MKYRKKPIIIDAIRFTEETIDECLKFCKQHAGLFNDKQMYPDSHYTLEIATTEGVMVTKLGDYVIKGIKGEFYPCKPDIFEQTYEKV